MRLTVYLLLPASGCIERSEIPQMLKQPNIPDSTLAPYEGKKGTLLQRFMTGWYVSNVGCIFVFFCSPPSLPCCNLHVCVSTCTALTIPLFCLFKGNTTSSPNRILSAAYLSAYNTGHRRVWSTWGHCQPGSFRLRIHLSSSSLPCTQPPVLCRRIQGP